jgi:hypothetical protein
MIERLNGEFRRRIKTQTVLPCAETVPMLLCALLASGQIHPLGTFPSEMPCRAADAQGRWVGNPLSAPRANDP